MAKSQNEDSNKRFPIPRGGKRGCLCKDGKTYSRKCCKGESYWEQGIGEI